MYKVLFWALMFVIYVSVLWLFPFFGAPEGYAIGNVVVAHIGTVAIVAFAWLVGFLHDKAFN